MVSIRVIRETPSGNFFFGMITILSVALTVTLVITHIESMGCAGNYQFMEGKLVKSLLISLMVTRK